MEWQLSLLHSASLWLPGRHGTGTQGTSWIYQGALQSSAEFLRLRSLTLWVRKLFIWWGGRVGLLLLSCALKDANSIPWPYRLDTNSSTLPPLVVTRKASLILGWESLTWESQLLLLICKMGTSSFLEPWGRVNPWLTCLPSGVPSPRREPTSQPRCFKSSFPLMETPTFMHQGRVTELRATNVPGNQTVGQSSWGLVLLGAGNTGVIWKGRTNKTLWPSGYSLPPSCHQDISKTNWRHRNTPGLLPSLGTSPSTLWSVTLSMTFGGLLPDTGPTEPWAPAGETGSSLRYCSWITDSTHRPGAGCHSWL